MHYVLTWYNKFRLHHRQLVDIQKTGVIPPESQKHEYDYSPMPADTIPPVGPNLLMHFFTHPEEATSQCVILRCIPKRKNDKLEPCPIAGSSTGWGIDIVTGIDQLKLFGLGFLGSLASVVFGICWTVVKRDIQGGFAVAGFTLALFGLAIASIKALDF